MAKACHCMIADKSSRVMLSHTWGRLHRKCPATRIYMNAQGNSFIKAGHTYIVNPSPVCPHPLQEPQHEWEHPRVSPYRLAAHLVSAFAIFATLTWTALDLRWGGVHVRAGGGCLWISGQFLNHS